MNTDNILNNLVQLNNDKPFLTGEKDLIISKQDLIEKVKKINPDYLEAMECEANILVRQGLFRGYFNKNGYIEFSIPDWDRFISAVNAFHISYQPISDDGGGKP